MTPPGGDAPSPSSPDTPAKWASRELKNLANFIPEDGPWGWVRNKLVNSALEIQGVEELINRADKEV